MVYALSVHATYACRRSGACCTAGWPIPVEPRLLPLLDASLLIPGPDGACEYYDRGARACRIQRDHGEQMLPESCFQFPRRALLDDRGTFVSLSHFCPTAAALLWDSDEPLEIVAGPAAFPDARVYDGFDARGQWPPLVKPGTLFDLATYARWERFLVSVLARDEPVDVTLTRIAAAAERVRQWTVDRGPLDRWTDAVLHADATPSWDDASAPTRLYEQFRVVEAYERLRTFVPEGLTPPAPAPDAVDDPPVSARAARAVRRYLAAKAFGSWAAYESQGVRTLVAELMLAELVLRVERRGVGGNRGSAGARAGTIEAIRRADHFLIHLMDRPRLLDWIGQVEAVASPALRTGAPSE